MKLKAKLLYWALNAFWLGLGLGLLVLPAVNEIRDIRYRWAVLLASASAGYRFCLGKRAAPKRSALACFRTFLSLSTCPIGISFVFGWAMTQPGLSPASTDLIWLIGICPCLEELIFRGILLNFFRRKTEFYETIRTNPVPWASLLSSLSFSAWHFQNIFAFAWPIVGFQMVYTFWVGIWLSTLYDETNSIIWPIAAHALLNAASLFSEL